MYMEKKGTSSLKDSIQVILSKDDIEFCKINNRNKWEDKNKYEKRGKRKFHWNTEKIDHHLSDFLADYDKAVDIRWDNRNRQNVNVLDIGTCDGVQAEYISKLGFNTLGIDISQTAIDNNADKVSENLNFIYDDILDTKLKPNSFDIIFDRGCFHSIVSFGYKKYIRNVRKLLKTDGILLLKVMHSDQVDYMGMDQILKHKVPMPFQFSKVNIIELFEKEFTIISVKDSIFESDFAYENKLKCPQALFCVAKKRRTNERWE